MFNSGYRSRRAKDIEGVVNPQTKYVQTSSPQISISNYAISGLDDTSVDIAGGQTILINGSGFAVGVSAVLGGVQIGAVTLVSPTQISFTAPVKSPGTYSLIVYNTNGNAAILVPGIVYSSIPVYTTPANSSIGSVYETKAISTSVIATSDSALTYTLVSGSLPTGATLASNGTITGTAPIENGSTTYNFSIKATDAELQDVTQSFTLTVNTDVLTWVTPSASAVINLDDTAYTQTLSATDAAGYAVSYTANALPTGLTLSSGVISGTPTVEGTTTTLLTATAATTNRTATNTVTWQVQLGDAYFSRNTVLLPAESAIKTPSFVTDNSSNNQQLVVLGDTKAHTFNPYQHGFYSYKFPARTDSVSIPASTALTTFTGDFTFECWVFPNDTSVSYWSIWDSRETGQSATSTVITISQLASHVVGQGRLVYYNGSYNYGTGIVYYNKWSHIAIVRIGTTLTFYIDGVAGGTSTVSGTQTGTASANPIYIGSKDTAAATTYGTAGYISNFRVVNGTGVYSANFTPPTGPLSYVANTVLLVANSNRFIDSSPRNVTLTNNATVAISSAHPFSTVYQAGELKYSTYFNGSSDYITLTPGTFGSNDFTIEFWFFTSLTSASGITFFNNYRWYNGLTPGSISIYANGLGNIGADVLTGGGSAYSGAPQAVLSATYPSPNAWHHVALTRSGGTVYFSVDGVTTSTTLTSNTALNLESRTSYYIGTYGDNQGGPGWWMSGLISNFRIVKGQALYTGNFTPSTTPLTKTTVGSTGAGAAATLTGTVTLLTFQDTVIKDSSLDARTLTFATTTQKPVAASPFTPSSYTNTEITTYGSGYFDGTGDYLSNISSASLQFGTNNFTIEMWVYFNSIATDQYIFNYASSGPTHVGINYYSGAWRIGGFNSYLINTGAVTTGQWYHVAMVRNNNSLYAYINGVQLGTAVSVTGITFSASGNGYIGAYYSTQTLNPSVFVSDLRIVNGTALYTSNFVPQFTSKLTNVSNTQLLTLQTNGAHNTSTVKDVSGFGLVPTRNGNSNLGSVSPYGDTWSIYFNGSSGFSGISMSTTVGTTPLTIECWMFPTATTAGQNIIGCLPSVTASNRIGLYFGSGNLQFVYTTSSTTQTTVNGPAVAYNTWSHVAVSTLANGTVYFAVNGVITTTTGATFTNLTGAQGSTWYIGQAQSIYDVSFTGFLSNIRVTNGSALYTSAYSVPTSPLQPVAGTLLLTAKTNRFIDSSFTNTALTTVTSFPQVQKFSPFYPITTSKNYSTYCSSTSNYWSVTPVATAFPYSGTSWTLEGWFLFNSFTAKVGLLTYGDLVQWTIASGGTSITFDFRTGAVWTTKTESYTFSTNTWYHIAAVNNSNSLVLYINGTAVGTATSLPSVGTPGGTGAAALWIGVNDSYTFNSVNDSLVGSISNFRSCNIAVYTGNFTVPTSGLSTTQNAGTNISAITTGQCKLLTFNTNNVVDASGNCTIVSVGAPVMLPTGPFAVTNAVTGYSPTVLGGSMNFDGTGDLISFPYNKQWAFANDFTVECWVYWNSTSHTAYAGIMACAGSSVGWSGWQIIFDNTNNYFRVEANNATLITGSNITLTPYQWYHIAFVRSGTACTLYYNGQIAGTGTSSATFDSGSSLLYIGAERTPSAYFNGYISDVKITNGGALYKSPFVPSSSPASPQTTVGGVKYASSLLLNGNESGVVDMSRNIDFESVGDAKVTQVSPYNGNNYSYQFNGSSDYLSTTKTGGWLTSGGNFTIEFWGFLTAYATASTGVYNACPFGTAGNSNGWEQGFSGTATSYTSYYFSMKGVGTVTATYAFNLSTWYHIAIVKNGTTTSIYINGVSTATTTAITSWTDNTGMNIGQLGVSGYNFWYPGYVSNARIVNGTAVYTANFTPPATSLTAVTNTVLLTAQNNKFIDNSAAPVTLTPNSTVKVATANPFQINTGNSYYFDGTGDYLTAPYNAGIMSYNTGDLTIECWFFNTAAQTNSSGLFSYYNGSSAYFLCHNHLTAYPNLVTVWVDNYGAGTRILTGTTTLVIGQWYHMAITRASGVWKLWLNGVQEGSSYTNTAEPTPTSSSFRIGYGSAAYQGYITDFRISKGNVRYSATFTPPTSPIKNK